MEKAVILWASPHNMLEEQERELKELFGDGAKIVNIRDVPDIPNIFASPDDKAGLYELAFKFLTAAQREGFSVVVQPAGSPAFQFILGAVAQRLDTHILIAYSHAVRVSSDELQPDGTVRKVSVFRHEKFIFM